MGDRQKTIYLITSGEYSEYCVLGFFYDKEVAEQYALLKSRPGDKADVEECYMVEAIVDMKRKARVYAGLHFEKRGNGWVEGSMTTETTIIDHGEVFIEEPYRDNVTVWMDKRVYSEKAAEDRLYKYLAEKEGL